MIIGGVAVIISTGGSSILLFAAVFDAGIGTADIIIQGQKKELSKTAEGKEFLETWETIYTVGGVVTATPVAIKLLVTAVPKIVNNGAHLLQVSRKTIANPELYKRVKEITTKAIQSIEIPNFNKTGLEILKKGFKSIPELKNAINLQELGVIFVKGAENSMAAIYNGVVIASGKAKELSLQLFTALNLSGNKLINYLKELTDVCTLVLNNKKFLDVIRYVIKNRGLEEFLTIYEEAIIFYYTTSAYENLNLALRGLINLRREYISFEKLLNSALDKLPNSIYNSAEHTLYRSVEMSEELIQNLFIGKTEYIEKAFTSTSYNYEKFLDWFEYQPSHNVIFKIQGKNGKLVEAISDIKEEAEVLFKSRTEYEILNVSEAVHPFDTSQQILEIILKEK